MKNKQVAFFSCIAALLWGTASHAAQITSKEYVDAKNDAILQTVTNNYSTTEQVQTIVDNKGTEVLENVDTKLGAYYNKTEVDGKVADVVAGDMSEALKGYAKTVDVNIGLSTKADQTAVGIMGALTTTAKDTIVNAINEVKADSVSAANSAAIAVSTAQSAETVAGEAKSAAAINAGVIATKANSVDVYTKTEVNAELDNKLDVASLDNYATTDELTTGLSGKASIDSLNSKEDVSNKSNNIAVDSGSSEKYTSVNAVQIYALPKPSAGCLAESAQCVLAINKSTGVVYWENVVAEGN